MNLTKKNTEKKDVFLTRRYFLNVVYQNEDRNEFSKTKKLKTNSSEIFPSFQAESYEVFVTIKGKISLSSGLIIQRDLMDQSIKKVLDIYDRKFLNFNLKHFTGECLAQKLVDEIKKTNLKEKFVSLRLKKKDLGFKISL